MAGTYQQIFAIELLHSYFTDNCCNNVSVVPDMATTALLSRLKIIWKQVDNKVYFLTQSLGSPGSYTPFVPFDPSTVLRFSLVTQDNLFHNYTKLDGWANQSICYFSNLAANTVTISSSPTVDKNFLSAAITGFNGSTAYTSGELCLSSSIYYEAVQGSTGNTPDFSGGTINAYQLDPSAGTAISSPGSYYWYNRGTSSIVSGQDTIPVAGNSFNFNLSTPSSSVACSVYSFDFGAGSFDNLASPAVFQSYSAAVSSYNVSLQGLSTGLYIINVNGATQKVFVDGEGEYTNSLGIIEIYANPAPSSTTSAYNLFANGTLSGTLNNPLYTIQFSAKLVYWQYVARNSTIVTGVTFGNVSFSAISSPVTNSMGLSELMIPFYGGVNPSSFSTGLPLIVHPQATGPPSPVKLPMAQVEQISYLDPLVPTYVSLNYLNF